MQTVIVLGKGELACRICQWFLESDSYSLEYVVPVIPEPSWTSSLTQWCRSNDVRFVDSGHFVDLDDIKEPMWKADLVFSVFYDKILPGWFLEKSRRAVNLHNGPLPKYRGMNPINWALKNGETTHGVTIHEMVPAIDAGPIIAQLTYSIYPQQDEVADVYKRSLAYGYALFQETMPILDKIDGQRQSTEDATYFSSKDQAKLGDRSNFTRAVSAPC